MTDVTLSYFWEMQHKPEDCGPQFKALTEEEGSNRRMLGVDFALRAWSLPSIIFTTNAWGIAAAGSIQL